VTTPYLTPPIFSWPAAPGGKLHTYLAGGNTPQATYSDAAGVTPNTNPVTLDSNGSAVVRLAVGVAYHFVLRDALDVGTLWDADNFDNAYLTSGTITAAIIGAVLYPQTAAELAAGITPTVYSYAPGDLRRYGGAAASSDNTAALQAAVNQAAQTGGAEVYCPAGNFNFVSTATAVCTIPGSNVTVRGAGKTVTIFTITGVAVITNGFFTGVNLSNIHILDLAITGNNQSSGFTSGGAISFFLTSAAVANIGNYHIERCAFTNFKCPYWIQFAASGAPIQSFGMQKIRIKDCDFTSLTGNAFNGSSQVYPAHCIALFGGYTPAATMLDVEVSGCTAECTYIKGFFINWGGTLHVSVHHNTIKNVGKSAQLSDDAINYALVAYQNNHYSVTAISAAASAVVTAPGHVFTNGDYVTFSSILDAGYNSGVPSVPGTLMAAINWQTFGPISGVSGNNFTIPLNSSALSAYSSGGAVANLSAPDLCEFAFNTIDGVRDAGIYLAATNRVTISNNTILGQTSTLDGTLPKGAIALNQDLLPTLDDNKIYNCAFGISIVPAIQVSQNIRNTEISAIPVSGNGIKINPVAPGAGGSGCVGEVIIDGLKIDATAASVIGVYVYSNSTIGIANFELRNFKITCPNVGIYQFSSDATVPALGNVRIFNGLLANFTNTGLRYSNCSNANTRAVIGDVVFSNPIAGSNMIIVAASSGLTIRNLTFNDMTSGGGFAWSGGTAQGRMEGVRFSNVAVANRYSGAANEMGVIAPAWTGNVNDFVQDLNITEQGAAASKYLRIGWSWDRVAAAWKEMRCLTGN